MGEYQGPERRHGPTIADVLRTLEELSERTNELGRRTEHIARVAKEHETTDRRSPSSFA